MKPWHLLPFRLGLVSLCVWVLAFTPQAPTTSPPIANSWIFPLGDDGYTYTALANTQYGLTVENTNYGARNLDLRLGAEGITCFGVGAHRLYNTGVDLFRVGNSTIGAEVKAVANGVISYVGSNYPGAVVVLSHTIPNTNPVYSLYGHLVLTMPLTIGDVISKGAVLGTVMPFTYTSNFPELHPNDDHAHLHFEIRTFADATTLGLPADCNTQYGPAGMGYISATTPTSYGYRNPLSFLQQQTQFNRVYLPITRNAPPAPCQEGQNLLQNAGFEAGTLSNPQPWVGVSTRFVWNAPLVSILTPYQGQRGAHMGEWDNGWVVDEELNQSFIMPTNTFSTTWRFWAKLVPDNALLLDLDDYFFLTFTDGQRGYDMIGGLRYDGSNLAANSWFSVTTPIFSANNVVGRKINVHISAWSDEARPTVFAIDDVELITHCAPTNGPMPTTQAEEGLRWEVKVTPLSETGER